MLACSHIRNHDRGRSPVADAAMLRATASYFRETSAAVTPRPMKDKPANQR